MMVQTAALDMIGADEECCFVTMDLRSFIGAFTSLSAVFVFIFTFGGIIC